MMFVTAVNLRFFLFSVPVSGIEWFYTVVEKHKGRMLLNFRNNLYCLKIQTKPKQSKKTKQQQPKNTC